MADLTKIKINGQAVTRPPEFQPKREDVYAAEYTTCTGKIIADRIGWKYSDMALVWDALPQSEVEILTGMKGECTLEFDDPEQDVQTESIVRSSIVYLRHRYTVRGEVWWKNVEMEVKFLNVHTD